MVEKALFVCTGNMDRSPTAEWLLKGKKGFEAKSAGTWIHAEKRISKDLVDWADIIFAMEEKHKEAILAISPEAKDKVIVLNVPDIYGRNDPELVRILEEKLSRHLKMK